MKKCIFFIVIMMVLLIGLIVCGVEFDIVNELKV